MVISKLKVKRKPQIELGDRALAITETSTPLQKNGRNKLPVLANDVLLYVENPKESIFSPRTNK